MNFHLRACTEPQVLPMNSCLFISQLLVALLMSLVSKSRPNFRFGSDLDIILLELTSPTAWVRSTPKEKTCPLTDDKSCCDVKTFFKKGFRGTWCDERASKLLLALG